MELENKMRVLISLRHRKGKTARCKGGGAALYLPDAAPLWGIQVDTAVSGDTCYSAINPITPTVYPRVRIALVLLFHEWPNGRYRVALRCVI